MSRRFAIISHNENEEYSFFSPITKWCWEQLNWECIDIDANELQNSNKKLQKYSTTILSQCSRLFACQLPFLNDEDYLMTSDIDMLPLIDFNYYFKYNPDSITTMGWDLTNYEHIPICYIGMKAKKWREILSCHQLTFSECLEYYLSHYKNHWTTDQDIITNCLKNVKKDNIKRGIRKEGTIPFGRLDRFDWLMPEKLIDCHILRPGYTNDNWNKISKILKQCWGKYPDEFNLRQQQFSL